MSLVVQQTVTDGPEGDAAWHVVVDDGAVSVRPGEAPEPDVTFRQSYETAAAIGRGELSAQTAFMIGKLRVGGNVELLMTHQGTFDGVEDVFEAVRGGHGVLMPELPEVQAHAERLDAEFAGTALAKFRPITFTALKTAVPAPEAAVDHELVFVGRRGKQLLLDFGTVTFVVHLMQGGRLKPDEKQSAKPRGGIARWVFADGRALLLTEAGTERKAGVWVVSGDPETQDPLDRARTRRRPGRPRHAADAPGGALDAAARVPPRPARHRRPRPPAGQRDLPPGQAVAVRQRVEALRRTRSSGCPRRSPPASPSRSPTSAAATT